jgi:hypothetical protein
MVATILGLHVLWTRGAGRFEAHRMFSQADI